MSELEIARNELLTWVRDYARFAFVPETVVSMLDRATAEAVRAVRVEAEILRAERELLRARIADLEAERDFVLAAARANSPDRLRARLAAAERELERWRHGEPVEGDFVCPNALALDELRAQLARLTRTERQELAMRRLARQLGVLDADET